MAWGHGQNSAGSGVCAAAQARVLGRVLDQQQERGHAEARLCHRGEECLRTVFDMKHLSRSREAAERAGGKAAPAMGVL
jgi:hypothetical protein